MRKITVLFIIWILFLPAYSNNEHTISFNLKELHKYKSVILIINSESGIILDKSYGATEYYKYPELIGMNINQINILSPDEIKKEIEKAENEKRNFFKFKHRLNNGKVRNVSVASYPMIYGGKNVLVSMVRDITQEVRKEIEVKIIYIFFITLFILITIIFYIMMKKIEKSEKKYEQLFDNMTVAFSWHEMIYDSKGNPNNYKFIDVNPYFEKITGLDKSKIIGKTVKDILPNTEDYWIEVYGKVAKSGEPVFYQNYSKEIDKYFNCYAFFYEKDKFAVIFSDVTAEIKLQNQLKNAKEQAEAASKSKSEFLANMSHEIRTPMNGIIGFIDVLLDIEKDEEKKEMLELVYKSSEILLEIINDILSLSKIEAGQYELYEKKTDIYETFKIISNLQRKQCEHKNVEFIFEYSKNAGNNILIDERPIIQITNNLLNNSVKFTDKGYIKLRVENDNENLNLKITVEDSGIGISENKMKRLFEPFVQGEEVLTKKYGGSGLGLAIIKELTKILNGTIDVESEKGKGTKFKIVIPYKKTFIESNRENIAENPKKEKIKRKVSIAVVEDNIINQKLIQKMIGTASDLKIIEDGRKVTEELENNKFEIILMDIQLPGMNGYDITKIIKSNEKFKDIIIIAISSFVLDEDVETAFKSGMDDYITKPIKYETLVAKINKWIDFIDKNKMD